MKSLANSLTFKTARVLIVDDHPLIRAGVRSYLTAAPGFEVLAETDNGQTALELCEIHQPDLLFLDLNLPGLSGLEIIRELRAAGSQTKILVLSAHDDMDYISQLIRTGANGYIYKGAMGGQIVEAATQVLRGENWLSPQLATRLFFHKAQPRVHDLLSRREIEILTLIASGLENDEIAEQLYLSKNTVQNYTSLIYSKINVKTRSRAIVYAIKQGLVELDKITMELN